jgi:hypothetical protein
MEPTERMELAAQKFADRLHDAIAQQVQRALELERDRFDAELLELNNRVMNELLAMDARLKALEAIERANTDFSWKVPDE